MGERFKGPKCFRTHINNPLNRESYLFLPEPNKCCVSNCLNLKNNRRCHVNRRQNKRTKKNSGFYSHVYQTILLGDFFLDYIVELKQNYLLTFLKVYPIYR